MFASVWSCFTTFMVAAFGIFVSSVTSTLYGWTTSGKYLETACLELLTASPLRQGHIARICSVRSVRSWNGCSDKQRSGNVLSGGQFRWRVISRTEIYTLSPRYNVLSGLTDLV